MSARVLRKALIGFYLILFFAYLFGPLLIMGVTAFNSSSYPAVHPFEGFTLTWFEKLNDDRDLIYGLQKSLLIGALVVLVAVPIGLAGAMIMQQIYSRARSLYYLVVSHPSSRPASSLASRRSSSGAK